MTNSKGIMAEVKGFYRDVYANRNSDVGDDQFQTFVQNLRANVGIHRESQISCEKSNFGLYHPNNPLEWLFQKMILKNPQALYI